MMNRRTLVAGMAAMIPTTVAGQDATPQSDESSVTMDAILNALQDGDVAALWAMAEPRSSEMETFPSRVAEIIATIYAGGDDVEIGAGIIGEDPFRSVTHATAVNRTSGEQWRLFIYVALGRDSGLIRFFDCCMDGI